MASDGAGHAGHDGTGDDAGPCPLGRPRRQFPDGPALLLPRAALGHPVVGVLSSAWVPSRGCLPAGRRCSCGHPSGPTHPWLGAVLCQSVGQAGARAGLLPVLVGQYPATALVSSARRAGGPQRRGKSRQPGPSRGQEGPVAGRKASAGAAEGQQAHTHSRRALHAGVMAYSQRARSLAATHRRGGRRALLGAGGTLWQPSRRADGAAEPSAPHVQAARRCGMVFPPHRLLGRARAPSHVGL
jgi:hypothetical protein